MKFLLSGIVPLLILTCESPLLADEESTLRAGAAKVDISPQTLPALMNGGFLHRRADRVLDPLYARSFVISDGEISIAFVIVDSCMIPRSLCDEIKRLASNQTSIAKDRILISATHTHSAPATMEMCLGCPADDAYVEYLPERVAQAIVDAHANLQAAKIGWQIVDGSELTNCRRWITRSDRIGTDPFGGRTVRAMMHPGYLNPNYTSPAGPIDPWLSVLSAVSARDGTPIFTLANLSMHYFGGGGFSADYFGEVARSLEAKIEKTSGRASPDFVGIMSQGTSGDLHWMDYSKPSREITRKRYSQLVADRVLLAWANIEHRSDLTLAMAEKRLTIDRRIPSQDRRQWARPINAARLDRLPRNRVEVYAQQAEWIHENPKEEVVLQAVRIGDLGITAIPNEVYGITGLKLKRQSPTKATFNLELANGAAGYIPPPEQHRLGGYTTWPARTAGLSEKAEPLIVDTLLDLLEAVAGKKRRPLHTPDSGYSTAVMSRSPVAYWRMDDIESSQVADAVGENDASYEGGVALFLPQSDESMGPLTAIGDAAAYGNRCVYLAGGHVAANLPWLEDRYSAAMCFWNALPTDARDTTGVLLSNESETLRIAGKAGGEDAGKLVLSSGGKSWTGSTRVAEKHWQQVAIVRDRQRVRVYLDGRAKPEIDAVISPSNLSKRWLIGSSGDPATTFDGKVDEVAVFDRILTAKEIAELYESLHFTRPSQPKPNVVLSAKPADAQSRKRYADAVLASKPVAFWRLHDDSNQSAANAVGEPAARYEPQASPLRPGDAQSNFTGGRVLAQVPGFDDAYSVELWFRNELPVNSRPVTAYLFSRAVDGIVGADGDNLGIGGTHSHIGKLIVFNGNGRNELIAGQTRIAPGSWSHVVMIRHGKRITVYLNGDPEPEIEADLPVGYPEGCKDFLLGGRADDFANLQGMLEEVALYDRALSPGEVKAHFNAAGVNEIEEAAKDQAAKDQAAKDQAAKDQAAKDQAAKNQAAKNQASNATSTSEPTPTDTQEALKTIHVPNGFKVELVVAEPLVKDPVAVDWGPDGKLWVVEMADYPLGVDGNGKPGGRVRFLEDADGDGSYDSSTLFADDLCFPTGVLAWGRGVLITAAPEIIYLEDSSGDGKSDLRRVLYSGFLEGNQQLRVNGLRWGLDNWVYCASGSHHGGYGKDNRITSLLTGKKYPVGSRDFRIRPDTGAIDPQSGPSQYGRNRDDWGNWFGVQNSHPLWHYVLADHHIRRNPHFAPPDPKHQVVTPSNPKVFPASKLQKRYHNFSQSGRFTSACSAMIYRDSYLFDRGTEQHAFTCEPFHNLVQHNLIAEEGVSFKFRRDDAEANVDFFASEDRWCRPVMVRTGPDGALWVVDMYRYMIEHPQWLPEKGKEELRPWYRAGEDHGRIYRVVRSDRQPRDVVPLADLSAQQLVATLESTNGLQRDMAQRMLVQGQTGEASTRASSATIRSLTELATDSKQAHARIHALWTLEGLGRLSTSALEARLHDSHAGVRRNAVRIAASIQVDINQLEPLVSDSDAKVRLELAATLGAYDSPRASALLAALIVQSREDRYIKAAAMSSLNPRNVLEVLLAVAESSQTGDDAIALEMIEQAVAMGEKETIEHVLNMVSRPTDSSSDTKPFDSLVRVLDTLLARKWPLGELSQVSLDSIEETTRRARDAAFNEKAPTDVRAAAIGLLGRDEDRQEEDFHLMESLLVPRTPSVVQRAVVDRLARRGDPAMAEILLAGWRSHSPELRRQILDAVASRPSWAEVLRERLETGSIRASELDASVRQRLLDRSKNASQWQKALAIKASTDREDVLRRFEPALRLAGDSRRGAIVFRKLCINCHKVKDEGYEVGPQLASITNKTKDGLLTSILDPSAAVDAKYLNYSVITEDGRSFQGRLETETGSSITLLAAEGKRKTILRRDIEVLQASNKSVMPDGLEQGLKPQDLADLVQFVRDTFQ